MISTCSEDDASVLYDHRDDVIDEDEMYRLPHV
jgi:hypothetical protein